MPKLTRRRLLCATAPLAAAAPLGRQARRCDGDGGTPRGARPLARTGRPRRTPPPAPMGHAAMIGDGAPAVGGPNDLDELLYPPPPLPHKPGRVRDYTLVATDQEIEIAPGVFFPAWTYNGTVPGPVIRATEDDLLRVRFINTRLAPAHDPLPRDPPDEHGRRIRARRPGRRVHCTSSPRGPRASTSTTATRPPSRSTSTRVSTAPSSSTRRRRASPPASSSS